MTTVKGEGFHEGGFAYLYVNDQKVSVTDYIEAASFMLRALKAIKAQSYWNNTDVAQQCSAAIAKAEKAGIRQ